MGANRNKLSPLGEANIMNYKKYEDRLAALLRKQLKDAGFYKTGKLDKSIKYTFKVEKGTIKPTLTAESYLKDLDEGRFIDKFTKDSEVSKIINDCTLEYVKEKLTFKK